MSDYREPYPTWILVGMDVLAAGILVASFRDAWSVVCALGADSGNLSNSLVAGAVVLAIDASILLLEQARSHIKLRGGKTIYNDLWVLFLITISAMLNVRYLTSSGENVDRIIGAILGISIPSTIAVLGYLKGYMLAYNAQFKTRTTPRHSTPAFDEDTPEPPSATSDVAIPLFRLKR